MTDIILINPQPVVYKNLYRESAMYENPPLGLGYLAAALKKKGFEAKILDVGPEKLSIEDILDEINRCGVKIVGISSFIANHGNGIRTAKEIKLKYPDVKVLMGGPQVSFIPEEVLSHDFIDVVSLFEGEATIPELVAAILNEKPIDNIWGIAYKAQGKVKINPLRPLIENLDEIQFPAWDLFKLDAYVQPGVILTGRGCPYKCIFCAAGAMPGSKYRMRSTQNVVDEIEYLNKTFNISHMFFADYTFTANKAHCIDICREIRNRGLQITWDAEVRANTVDDFIASEMAKAGCIYVQIGAESGDDNILRTIGKDITAEMIENAIKTFLKHGISVVCSFILGHPDDTKETLDKTIEFAVRVKNLAPDFSSCKFALLTPLPGTPIYEQQEKWGIKLLSDHWDRYTFHDPICETKHLNKKDLQNAYLKAWVSYGKGNFNFEEYPKNCRI